MRLLYRRVLGLLVMCACVEIALYLGNKFGTWILQQEVIVTTFTPTPQPTTTRLTTTTTEPVREFADRPPFYTRIPEESILRSQEPSLIEDIYHRYVTSLQVLCPVRVLVGSIGVGWPACTVRPPRGKDCTMYFVAKDVAEKHEFEAAFRCSVKIIDYRSFMTKLEKNNSTGSVMMELSATGQVSVMLTTESKQLAFFASLARRGVLRKVYQIYVTLDVTNGNTTSQHYMTYLQHLRDIHSAGFKIYHFKRIHQLTYATNSWRTGGYVLYFIRDTAAMLPAPVLPPITILRNITAVQGAALYHDYMLQSQFLCHNLVRVGQIGDGGWEVCNDTDVRPASDCSVYSFGMNGNWAFEIDMIRKFGCTVHSFDQNVNLPSYKNTSLIKRHLTGLWHAETFLYKNGGKKFRMETLKLLRTRQGHDKVPVDIVKIDVGAAEWHILPNIIDTGSLLGVRQLLIEVHVAIQGADIHFREKLVILRELYDMGFRLFWSHPSDNPGNTFRCSVNKKHTTCCYELHFINKKYSPAGWQTVKEYVSDDLASDSEDEKRIRQAEQRALRSIKLKHGSSKRSSSAVFNNSGNTATRYASPPAAAGSAPFRGGPYNSGVTAPRSTAPSDQCFSCGGFGHWRRDCGKFRQGGSRQPQQQTNGPK
ncbi:uncharacterized protein LOC110449639 [Mizuhopecten yessoensis]|uniref:uncharacterized protein LOC110449639 n=1 Tax=Mizuhopecten yessoensis TaxID=6573 RepID=UPI000B45AB95|nr:uncharacterized protein LOC110449639 [Mizuhopecten yessoensis]